MLHNYFTASRVALIFFLFARPSRLRSFSVPTGSIQINSLIFDARSSSSPPFRSDFSASLAVAENFTSLSYSLSFVPAATAQEKRGSEAAGERASWIFERRHVRCQFTAKARVCTFKLQAPSPLAFHLPSISPSASSHGFRSQKPFYRSPPLPPSCPRHSWKIYILRVGGLTNSLVN